MASTTIVSDHFVYLLGTGGINFESDIFKIILLEQSFVFDKASHSTLADVTDYQLITGNGYVENSKQLTGVIVTESHEVGGIQVVWDAVVLQASGGDIGPTSAAIIYDDTTTDDAVLMCIDFGQDIVLPDTAILTISDIEYNNIAQ